MDSFSLKPRLNPFTGEIYVEYYLDISGDKPNEKREEEIDKKEEAVVIF